MRIVDGWLDTAEIIKSPNYNQRPSGSKLSLLVIHNISLPPRQFGNRYVELFFQNQLPVEDHEYFLEIKDVEVSSHFFIKRDGHIIQFVNCDDRAWHAGKSNYCGIENCNDFSIGIEMEGADDIPYENEQYESLVSLTNVLRKAYPDINADRVTGHEHIAPGRKTDPGPAFDWDRYRLALANA